MKYDAMAIGNHEFDYGADNFTIQMNRVPFPVLGANIFFKGTDHPYSRPYTIIEKDGIRLGVIGIIGQDARSVALPSGITNRITSYNVCYTKLLRVPEKLFGWLSSTCNWL